MAEQSGPAHSAGDGGQDGRRPRQPAPDFVAELQRWFIRQGAKNVRREIGGQVRKTFGGGRTDNADVWDIATTEIPPNAGEAPECQWCPICRAARRMRESGPGLGGQLQGASEAVATAVQDALSAVDSLLSKPGGPSGPGASGGGPGASGGGSGASGGGSGAPAQAAEPDPWHVVTEAEPAGADQTPATEPDGQGHGADDRG